MGIGSASASSSGPLPCASEHQLLDLNLSFGLAVSLVVADSAVESRAVVVVAGVVDVVAVATVAGIEAAAVVVVAAAVVGR